METGAELGRSAGARAPSGRVEARMSAEWRTLLAGNVFVPIAGPREDALGEPLPWAFTLGTAELSRPLTAGSEYQARVCLFDERFGVFFGRPFRSPWRRLAVDSPTLFLRDIIFFHTMLRDGYLALVVEIVSRKEGGEGRLEAWTSIRVPGNHEGPDFAESQSIPADRWQMVEVQAGTPKSLLLLVSKEKRSQPPPIVGKLGVRLQGHKRLDRAKGFLLDATLVGRGEAVPGLQGPEPLLSPLPLGPAIGVLQDLKIHFGPLGGELEAELCAKLMKERLFRANLRRPADPSQRLVVRERHLRVGVHNGWCFIAEPQLLSLSSGAETGGSYAGSLGRRAQLPASSLRLRGKVELPELAEDPGLAVVLVLEYLMGLSGANAEGCVSVGVCWGAWSPFAQPRISFPTAVQACLLAGPSHNPAQKLFLKNLYRVEELVSGEKRPLALPHISAHFRFGLKGGEEEGRGRSLSPPPSSLAVPQPSEGSRPSPAPTLPSPPPPPASPSHPIQAPKLVTPIPSPDHGATRPDAAQGREPPLTGALVENIYQQPRKRHEVDEAPLDTGFAAPVAPIPRSVFAFLSSAGGDIGAPVGDRHGDPPDYVDLAKPPKPHLPTELADPCTCQEILIRFLALAGDLRTWDGSRCVFLAFQFYRFPPVSSEKLLLVHGPQDEAAKTGELGAPRFLRRMDGTGKALEGALGYQVKMTVDPAYLGEGELEAFLAYLAKDSLHVEVWDGDSMQLVGVASVPLRGLLRGGREAVQAWSQLPLQEPFSVAVPPASSGLLFLSAANVGYPPSRPAGTLRALSRNWALLSQRLARPLTAPAHYALPEKLRQPLSETAELDEDRRRKLRRLEGVRSIQRFAALRLVDDSSEKGRELSRNLSEIRALRAEAKPKALQTAAVEAVTQRVRLSPELGEVAFAELRVRNPLPQPLTLRLTTSQSSLQPVTSEHEWRHFKAIHGLRTPVEPSLWLTEAPQREGDDLKETSIQLVLRPSEAVYVPFKLEPGEGSLSQPFGAEVGRRKAQTPAQTFLSTTTAQAMLWQGAELFAGLILEVNWQPLSPDRIFRFRVPAHTAFSRLLRLDTAGLGRPVAGLRCSEAGVAAELRAEARSGAQLVELKAGVGGAPGIASFWLLLYTDAYKSRAALAWLFQLHAASPLRLDCLQGHPATASLLLRGGEVARSVRCFPALGASLRLQPSAAVLLLPHSLVEVKATFRSLGPPREEETEVTAVDVESGAVVEAWLLAVSLAPAPVAKRYQLALTAARTPIQKRIGFQNPYSVERSFVMETNRADLVTPEAPTIRLAGREEVLLPLAFASPPIAFRQPFSVEALVFVSDELGNNERTIAIQLLYTPPTA